MGALATEEEENEHVLALAFEAGEGPRFARGVGAGEWLWRGGETRPAGRVFSGRCDQPRLFR